MSSWDSQVPQRVRIRLQYRINGLDPRVQKIPEEGTDTHCSILAWRIPWTEEPGRLQSVGSQRVRHNGACMDCRQCWMSCMGQEGGNAETGRIAPPPHTHLQEAVSEKPRGMTTVPLHRWVTCGCHRPLMGQREEWTCLKSQSMVCRHELILDGASEPSCKGFRKKETESHPPPTQTSPLSD